MDNLGVQTGVGAIRELPLQNGLGCPPRLKDSRELKRERTHMI